MRNPAFYDRLDSKDRKKIRRIFLQMIGLYMSLIVILFGGVIARSMITVQSGTSLSQNANLP